MQSLNRSWTTVATDGSNLDPRPTRSVRRQAFAALRAPVWPFMLAAVCAVGLLLALQQVVHAGVLQGEARNRATAVHAQALRRCDFMHGAGQRASCHAQLQATRQIDAIVNAPAAERPKEMAKATR